MRRKSSALLVVIAAACIQPSGFAVAEGLVPTTFVADSASTGSAALMQAEQIAMQDLASGRREKARISLTNTLASATGADAAWARLSLALVLARGGDLDAARLEFEELLTSPTIKAYPAVQGQAAATLLTLESGIRRKTAADYIVDRGLPVTRDQYCAALLTLVDDLRAKHNYDAALIYARAVLQAAEDKKQWARAQTHIAAICMWQAHGGYGAQAEAQSADQQNAYKAAHEAMNALIQTSSSNPELSAYQLHAQALLVECYGLEKRDYDEFLEAGRFLERWGRNPSIYAEQRSRQAVNDVRVWRMLGAIVYDDPKLALQLANEFVNDPPRAEDESKGQYCVLYACAAGSLAAQALNQPQTAQALIDKGKAIDPAHFDRALSSVVFRQQHKK